MRTLALVMAFLPLLCCPAARAPRAGSNFLIACVSLSVEPLSPRRARHQVGTMPTRPVNGLATASLPSTILSGKRRQRARRRAVDHGRGFARIVVRIVTGALEQLLIRRPAAHLAAGMGTNRGIGDDPSAARSLVIPMSVDGSRRTSRTLLRRESLRTVLLAGSIGHASTGGPPTGISLTSRASGLSACNRDEEIPLLGPFARRLRPSRDGYRPPDPAQGPTSRSETFAGSTVRQQRNHNRDRPSPAAHDLAPAPQLDCGSTPLECSGSPAEAHPR